MRCLVDAKYMSQNANWEQRVRGLVARASALAEGRFSVRFEVVSVGAWDHPDGATLEPLLEQLRAEHPEGDADLVVGFTSSLQLFTASFEELGIAHLFGHHAVLRGIDQHEQSDIILNELRALSIDERVAVVRARVEHQEAIVFLHEWAHAWGAIHDRDPKYIMFPQYSAEQRELSPGGVKSIEIALKHLRGDRQAWVAEARTHLLSLPPSALSREGGEQLARMFGRADGGTAGAGVASDERPVSEADRKLFNIAVEKQREGRAADALGTMSGLLERYPRHPMVQTFACQLALEAKRADAEPRCATAMEVAPQDPRPAISLAWAKAEAALPAAREAALEARRRAGLKKREPGLQVELAQTLQRVGYLAYAEEEAKVAELTLPAQQVLEAVARQRAGYGLRAGVLEPDGEAAYVELWQQTLAALQSRKQAEARQRASVLTKRFPKVPGAWSMACEAQLALGFSGEARGSCGRALQLDAGLGRPHYLLALLDQNERKRGAAIEHLEKSIATDEGNEDAWRRLGALYTETHMDAARAALSGRYQAKFGRPLK